MKKRLHPLVFCILILVFFSCEKDFDYPLELNLNKEVVEYNGEGVPDTINIRTTTNAYFSIGYLKKDKITGTITEVTAQEVPFKIMQLSSKASYQDSHKEINYSIIFIPEYFSDEYGARITLNEVAQRTSKDVFFEKSNNFIFNEKINRKLYYSSDGALYEYNAFDGTTTLLYESPWLDVDNVAINANGSNVFFQGISPFSAIHSVNPSTPGVKLFANRTSTILRYHLKSIENTNDYFTLNLSNSGSSAMYEAFSNNLDVTVRYGLTAPKLDRCNLTYHNGEYYSIQLQQDLNNNNYVFYGKRNSNNYIKLFGPTTSTIRDVAISPDAKHFAFSDRFTLKAFSIEDLGLSFTFTEDEHMDDFNFGVYSQLDFNSFGELGYLKNGDIYGRIERFGKDTLILDLPDTIDSFSW